MVVDNFNPKAKKLFVKLEGKGSIFNTSKVSECFHKQNSLLTDESFPSPYKESSIRMDAAFF
jgi:hypothetical protein